MWSIGIKSGIITALGLVAYILVIQIIELMGPLGDKLVYAVLLLGIYSGHYFYKSANSGFMSYTEGVKVGLVVVFSAVLLLGLVSYMCVRLMDTMLREKLLSGVQQALQTKGVDEDTIAFIMHYMTPERLVFASLLSILLTGCVFTLIIPIFSRNPRKSVE